VETEALREADGSHMKAGHRLRDSHHPQYPHSNFSCTDSRKSTWTSAVHVEFFLKIILQSQVASVEQFELVLRFEILNSRI
jgi:hypothetical protein